MPRLRLTLLALVLAAFAVPAGAHAGPPFPIVVDQPAGPVKVSIWADPDIGYGTFYVTIEPLAESGQIPADLKVDVSVRPVDGRLPEKTYEAKRDTSVSNVQFYAEAEFDRQEFWDVRFTLSSSAGGGELTSQVEATPPGLGRWDLLLYLFPFLAIGVIWARAILKRRSKPAAAPPTP